MKGPKYKRILLKLSGESLSTDGEVIDPNILGQYAAEIKKVHDLGVEVAIVIGGGNIFGEQVLRKQASIACKAITWVC